jgi:hypothetical protein
MSEIEKDSTSGKPSKRRAVQKIISAALGVLGLALIMWTPSTGKGFLIYALLFVALVAVALFLPSRESVDHPSVRTTEK